MCLNLLEKETIYIYIFEHCIWGRNDKDFTRELTNISVIIHKLGGKTRRERKEE